MSATYSTSHYQAIGRVEREHFWFAARSRLLRRCLIRYSGASVGKTFLEVGCGTGIIIRLLESLGFRVTGLDVNQMALAYARKGTRAKLIRKSFYSFTSRQKFYAVGMFDVLEHQGNDLLFLQRAAQLLQDNGFLYLTVPAGMWLWSEIDSLSGHKRRYEAEGLKSLIERAGFSPVFCNYWQVASLPFYLLWRYLWRFKNKRNIASYVNPPDGMLNQLLFWLLVVEQQIIFRIRFPAGASLLVVAQKKRIR